MEIIVPKWAKFAGRIVHCRDKCSAARAHDEEPEQGAILMGETDESEDSFAVALDRFVAMAVDLVRDREFHAVSS